MKDTNQIKKESLAISLIKQGRLDEAEMIYRNLIRAGSKNHIVYGNLGAILKKKGDLSNSIWFFKALLLSLTVLIITTIRIALKRKVTCGAINSFPQAFT